LPSGRRFVYRYTEQIILKNRFFSVHNLTRRFFGLIIHTIYLCPLLAQAAESDVLSNFSSFARYSAMVSPIANSKVPTKIFGSSSTALFPPASTLKLLTATAAKIELGDNFTFTTSLQRLNNDVIIQFSGDPTLSTQDLSQLLDALKQYGISHIKGNLWLDGSLFSGYESAVGWPWDVLGVCYSAPSSAITIDHNCVPGSIYTNKDGTTRVYVPEQYPVSMTTEAIAVTWQQKKQSLCALDLYSTNGNNYHLNGCLPFRDGPLALKFALRNPSLYGQQQVTSLLKQLNISLGGNVKIGSPGNNEHRQLIAIKHSPTLAELVTTMLQKSDNLIANNLTKMIGQHYFNQPGTFNNGVEAIKILLTQQGIDLKSAQLYDGSGLSRSNRLSAQQLADVLRYIAKHDDQLNLIASLAQAGESGTLQYRSSMRELPIKGALIGKSGSIYATHNMAGFGLDHAGKPNTIFVQLVTDYFPDPDDKKSPLYQFEKQFYQYIVERSK
jgi:D-alanyl-D-alanine carboxypeptidase/D-alanyl-D-alanine-endopeptidase (penicillin-binding protein 4)